MINNIISEGTNIRGVVSLAGVLRIEGTLEGVIYNEGRVYISKSGRVVADIHAREVIIGGLVQGNVFSKEKVKLLNTARLKGNIYTTTIAADEGSVFDGDCVIIT